MLITCKCGHSAHPRDFKFTESRGYTSLVCPSCDAKAVFAPRGRAGVTYREQISEFSPELVGVSLAFKPSSIYG